MKLNNAELANVAAGDGSISTATGLPITVVPAAAANFALTNVTISAGSISATCLFTCTVTKLGNNGTIEANIAVTDGFGNTVSDLGKGHTANITSTGGTIAGSPLTIPTTGTAESTTQFTYTAKSTGNFTDTISVAKSKGTAYTSATATASR